MKQKVYLSILFGFFTWASIVQAQVEGDVRHSVYQGEGFLGDRALVNCQRSLATLTEKIRQKSDFHVLEAICQSSSGNGYYSIIRYQHPTLAKIERIKLNFRSQEACDEEHGQIETGLSNVGLSFLASHCSGQEGATAFVDYFENEGVRVSTQLVGLFYSDRASCQATTEETADLYRRQGIQVIAAPCLGFPNLLEEGLKFRSQLIYVADYTRKLYSVDYGQYESLTECEDAQSSVENGFSSISAQLMETGCNSITREGQIYYRGYAVFGDRLMSRIDIYRSNFRYESFSQCSQNLEEVGDRLRLEEKHLVYGNCWLDREGFQIRWLYSWDTSLW